MKIFEFDDSFVVLEGIRFVTIGRSIKYNTPVADWPASWCMDIYYRNDSVVKIFFRNEKLARAKYEEIMKMVGQPAKWMDPEKMPE